MFQVPLLAAETITWTRKKISKSQASVASLLEVLEALCYMQALSDVTFGAGKRELAAHKLVFSVCSSYFNGLFDKAFFHYDSRHAHARHRLPEEPRPETAGPLPTPRWMTHQKGGSTNGSKNYVIKVLSSQAESHNFSKGF